MPFIYCNISTICHETNSTEKVKPLKSIKKLFLVLILIAIASAVVYYFRDTEPPVLTLTPGSGPIAKQTKLLLAVNDPGMGLKELTVTIVQDSERFPLVKRDYPAGTSVTDIDIDLHALKLKQGAVQIEVAATDHSIYHLGKGNNALQTFDLTYDTRAPIISILSKAHNFTKGGSGLVVFSLNEDAVETGIKFGDYFFPAYQQEDGSYACLFAYPWDASDKVFVPRVIARDIAGNERQAGIYYRARSKKFRQRRINIDDRFLTMKTPEFETIVNDTGGQPIDVFLTINKDIRQQNRDLIAELSKQTASTALWEGAFVRQPGASSAALFADHRTYYYKGKAIDKQVHLGHDLASVAQDEIIAENTGVVVYSEYLGIYGQCVVIDHGLGLQSLYAHLSQVNVQQGDTIAKGQVIGNSGNSGMAGGDHLHLGMFVSGVAVQPIEWWDKHWLQNNIDSKLQGQ